MGISEGLQPRPQCSLRAAGVQSSSLSAGRRHTVCDECGFTSSSDSPSQGTYLVQVGR